MVEPALLAATIVATYLGFAFLALRQRQHRRAVLAPVSGQRLPSNPPPVHLLPSGIGCLVVAFCCSVTAQGPSFGSLLWVLIVGATSVAVTFTLTWRPWWLSSLLSLGDVGRADLRARHPRS